MRALIAAVLVVLALPVSAQAQDARRVALIVVDFPASDPADPLTMTYQRIDADRTQTFYGSQSYGRFGLAIDTFGLFQVPLDQTAGYDDIAREAQAAAISVGMDPLVYQHFVYVSPKTDLVQQLGITRGFDVWIAPWPTRVHPADFRVLAHELGHATRGLPHAHAVAGSDSEYGDIYDVMGKGLGEFNNITKLGLGWLDADQLPMITQSGDYVLTPLDTVGGLKGVRIDGGNKKPYDFVWEYRREASPYARDDPGGALLRQTFNGSTLVFINPAIGPFEQRPTLVVGQRWCDKESRVEVTNISMTPEGLTLRVRLGSCR